MIGLRTLDDPRWARLMVEQAKAARREQEALVADGRLLDYGPDHLLIDCEGWFAPQRYHRLRPAERH